MNLELDKNTQDSIIKVDCFKYTVMEEDGDFLRTTMKDLNKEELEKLGQIERPIYRGYDLEEVGFIIINESENKKYYAIKN